MPDVGASIHRVQPLYPVFRRFFYFFIAVVPFLSVSSWATIISFLLSKDTSPHSVQYLFPPTAAPLRKDPRGHLFQRGTRLHKTWGIESDGEGIA